MNANLTDTELNEAVALALGMRRVEGYANLWEPASWPEGKGHLVSDLPWATSVDACLADLLPAAKEVYPEGHWDLFEHDDGRWQAVHIKVFCGAETVTKAPTLARAICLVFLGVMQAN